MKKLFITLLALAMIWIAWIYARDYFRYHPAKNSHPKYFLTVKGHVDPAMKDQLKLTWTMYYYTTNHQCDKTYNWFEGVSGERQIFKHFKVTPDARGYYQLKLPIDAVKPGFCRWVTGAASYHFTYNDFKRPADAFSTLSFSPTGRKKTGVIKRSFMCNNQACSFAPGNTIELSYNLSTEASHRTIINFKQTK
jgi:hypothetical protein